MREGWRKRVVSKNKAKQNLLYSECPNGNSVCRVPKNTNVIDLSEQGTKVLYV